MCSNNMFLRKHDDDENDRRTDVLLRRETVSL